MDDLNSAIYALRRAQRVLLKYQGEDARAMKWELWQGAMREVGILDGQLRDLLYVLSTECKVAKKRS